jgi:hypothetical protein
MAEIDGAASIGGRRCVLALEFCMTLNEVEQRAEWASRAGAGSNGPGEWTSWCLRFGKMLAGVREMPGYLTRFGPEN